MNLGVDYYPEQWDESYWENDAKLMQEAGVNIVRLAEFAWCKSEPSDGEFDFSWLDRAIGILYNYGIKVILGTGSVCPPLWLIEKYPDVLVVENDMSTRYPAIRSFRCYNSPSLLKYCARYIDKLSKHYANNLAVIGWQTDNELETLTCNCKSCNLKFREWVKDKYETIEKLNDKWGRAMWGLCYSDWSQVTTPMMDKRWFNPSYMLDYYRFQGDSAIAFNNMQIDIIRKNCPNHFVTHNMWGYPFHLDYYKLCENLDFASLDNYPSSDLKCLDSRALSHDLVRGVKKKNFWVMEQLSGSPGCWGNMTRTPYPGMLRAYIWQVVSRGADTVINFRWRSSIIGAEQYWHGLIDHSNVPGRRFLEYKAFSKEFNEIKDVIDGTKIVNEVAILHSHEIYTAFKIQHQAVGMDYFENLKQIHNGFVRLGCGTDVINVNEEIDEYKVVVVPMLYLLDKALATKLENYAKNGGTLIITNRSGVKDFNNICYAMPLPGLLSECAGLVVDEYDAIGNDLHSVKLYNGKEYMCSQLCDIIKPTTAKILGYYNEDFYKGTGAVTVNEFGKGKVYYIGSAFENNFYVDLFKDILNDNSIEIFDNLPENVEVSVRENDDKRILFIINIDKTEKTINMDKEYYSLINKRKTDKVIKLDSFGVEIMEV